jgi:LPXTG-motif cell wall-anchored protein
MEEDMNSVNLTKTALVLLSVVLCFALAVSANAQVQTQKSTITGQASKEVQVERGEVVLVKGNDLVVKMEDGSIRHFPNVPESARITVDGKQLGIHDLKPGMKLQRTITTTTTPQTIKTVQTVTGKVWYVQPPNTVILTLEDGNNQSFKIPKGQKFMVEGQEVDAFGLRKGMVVTATKIVEVPETLVAQQKKVTGTMPPPPTAPPADAPMLIATSEPAPPPASAPASTQAAATPEKKLPKTGSNLPLVGLIGLLLISASFGVKLLRTALGN